MKNIKSGIFFGIIAGIIDVIPMILQKLTADACVSAFSLWVISSLLIMNIKSKVNGALKGIFISLFVLIPSAILIGWKNPVTLLPIFVMTVILGGALGLVNERYTR